MNITREQIKEDVLFLKEKVLETHPNPYFKITKEEFDKEIEGVIEQSRNTKDLVLQLRKFFSNIGDSHTRIAKFKKYLSEKEFAFECKYFIDGYYVIKTKEENKEHIGKKIIRINGMDIEKLESKLSKYIAAENEVKLRNSMIGLFTKPDFLEAVGLEVESLNLEFEDGTSLKLSLEKVDWDNLYDPLKHIELPYTLSVGEVIKYKYMEDFDTFYIKYNECDYVKAREMRYIVSLIKKHKPKCVVVDFRENIGGTTYLLSPVVNYLRKKYEDIKIVCFTGSKTFSSGVGNTLELTDIPNSLSLGCKTSGAPHKFGEADSFNLPNTGIGLLCSQTYFDNLDFEFGEPFVPDIEVGQSINDYLSGRDVVWERFVEEIK